MTSLITNSWIIDIILLFIPLLAYGFYKMKKNFNYFKDRGMPYLKKSMMDSINWKVMFLKETIEDVLDKDYKNIKNNKYAGMPSVIGNPTVMLRDPELIEKILIKDFTYFHDRTIRNIPIDDKINPLEANLFNLNGQMWRTLRAKLSPTFTSGKLKWMFSQIASCTDILIEHLTEKANGEDFLIRETISCYGFDVIACCAFGLDSQSQKNPNNEFRQKATQIFKPSIWLMVKSTFMFLLPKLARKLRMVSIDPEITEFFCNITKTAMANRKASGMTRNDFVQLLLQLKEKGYVEYDAGEENEVEHTESIQEKLEFTDELLTAQAFIFFIAGFEPVSVLIVYTLYALSKEQEIQTKVREEIKRIKEKHGEINYDSLKEMTYLECVMAETLRLHPPARLLIRSCTKTYKLDDGKQFEKDTIVVIPTYSLQRDPKHFPNPEEFKPERFEDGEQLSIRQGRGLFLPFGDGPRVCIARRFALLEAKLAIARIVESFKINSSPKNIEPLKRNPQSLIIEPIGGMWLRMEKIN